MASFWQKTLFYLGLVDDEGGYSTAANDDRSVATVTTTETGPIKARPPGTIAGKRVDPPDSYQRRSANWEHTEAGVYVQPDPGRTTVYDGLSPEPQTEVITARNFSDAQLLADGIGNGRAVVLDLRNTEPEMVRRLVDFTSGLTYALNGKMAKIAQGVILVSPAGVTVGEDELSRLATAGLYSAG
jgi:FtsZ-interacting cell division protein YlmF